MTNTDNNISKKEILALYGIQIDRLVREKERQQITSISRSQAWKLERTGMFPKRKYLGNSSCAWLLSDLLLWCYQS
ncbi:AlpA family transcriptional regulator [Xenorhabdus bovienii]|uniref:AlpA family phage regulatory protein n=1 Tax=Xenorhabdus bovienii TaxID=40576 RepID=UPI00237D0238|nr:AlpA family phage regulatory protein [Xenorhabdus bovienii]MDE1482160.1 AlpA family transcriptional regulator [Xenorhabdus bovienii]MDE9465620.1 AlpA family transcriptional regulator [Xenorhabdus bovienii]MDE9468834.1 AlpA family transcriptional regulator [Xenorhabdus bovienii]MDE9547572.1 AlpA family transcriptional regulator [Xenorhabdus bovienii]MDE9555993.1 AlpA family transcriptional regulator [Xenorhabdus bovienii]